MSKNSNTLTSNASAILESCSSLGFLLSVSYFYNVDKFILLFSLNCSIVSFRAFLYFFIVLAVTEVTTEVRSEETEKDIAVAKASEEKTDKEDNRSADNETASKQEEKSEQNDEPEQKAPASGNKEAGGNPSNAGNGGQTTDNPKDNVSNPLPASVAYSPQIVVSLATEKCQAGGMVTTQRNLQNHLNDGSITQEEYNEYYPYDGMEGSYYGIITSAYIDLMPKGDINSEYFHYLLHSFDVMKVFYNMGNGVRQGLNYSEFSKLLIFAPSKEEQDEIVKYLNDKCSVIEKTILLKKEQLATLEEYKKSIIYEYVTGKREVL